jgi:hypothetical protein
MEGAWAEPTYPTALVSLGARIDPEWRRELHSTSIRLRSRSARFSHSFSYNPTTLSYRRCTGAVREASLPLDPLHGAYTQSHDLLAAQRSLL